MSAPLLSVRGLDVSIRGPAGLHPVVRDVGFDLHAGEMLGLAGESGCGKTLTALALSGLLPAGVARMRAERLRLGERDLLHLTEPEWRRVRGPGIGMLFQDPGTALDPVFTIGWQIARATRRARKLSSATAKSTTLEALDSVGFGQPDVAWGTYPHELSGGMRQLAMIALAVAVRPAVLLADEPTTGLDVTTQARVLEELGKLRAETGTGILLISHDLGVIAQCAESALVMYCGRLVERAPSSRLFTQPAHPYTAGLLAATPRLDGSTPARVRPIPGQVPPPGQAPAGCPFAPRCNRADAKCQDTVPALKPRGGPEVACHHPL